MLAFPYSNVGLAQVFPGENAECVCQALKQIFEYVGGVPTRIVFDNATGIGRRVCGGVRTTELFGRFAAHYDFAYAFCNPNSGHEKGSVENKVGFIRRNLLVPMPQLTNAVAFNKNLLARCMESARKPHWIKGEPEEQLFVEDRFAMLGLPSKPFEAVRYLRPVADKKGKVQVDGPHFYSTSRRSRGGRCWSPWAPPASAYSTATAPSSASMPGPTAVPRRTRRIPHPSSTCYAKSQADGRTPR